MPVLGHAFVGLAVGTWTHPNTQCEILSDRRTLGIALWTPMVVGLSYLPDILAQLALLLGGKDIRYLTHAVPSAVVMSLALAPLLALVVGVSRSRTFVVVFVCLFLHDLLDLLQTTDRRLWWPLSNRVVGYAEPLIPTAPMKEAVLFAVLYLIALFAHQWEHWPLTDGSQSPVRTARGFEPSSWLSIVVTTAMILAATMTHHLRYLREQQFERARMLSQEMHDYQSALMLLNTAERWPSTTKPGRIDYLRGWTYEQLGERRRAEECYLRSDQADPVYFWTVVDTASFYASGPEPLSVREQRVAPYLRRLREEFTYHPGFSEAVMKIQKRLVAPQASPQEEQRYPDATMKSGWP